MSEPDPNANVEHHVHNVVFYGLGFMVFMWAFRLAVKLREIKDLYDALKHKRVVRLDGLRQLEHLTRVHLQQIVRARSSHETAIVEKLQLLCHVRPTTVRFAPVNNNSNNNESKEAKSPSATKKKKEDIHAMMTLDAQSECRVTVYIGLSVAAMERLYTVMQQQQEKAEERPILGNSVKKGTKSHPASPRSAHGRSPSRVLSEAASAQHSPRPSTGAEIEMDELKLSTDGGTTLKNKSKRSTTWLRRSKTGTATLPAGPVGFGLDDAPFFAETDYLHRCEPLVVAPGLNQTVAITLPRHLLESALLRGIFQWYPIIMLVQETQKRNVSGSARLGEWSPNMAVSEVTIGQIDSAHQDPVSSTADMDRELLLRLRKLHFERQMAVSRYHLLRLKELFGEEERECVVCLVDPKDVILLPCRHVCVCHKCHPNLEDNKCPMCRGQIVNHARFMPFDTLPAPPVATAEDEEETKETSALVEVKEEKEEKE